MKKYFLLIICLALFSTALIAAPAYYSIENVAQKNWGKIVSVFNKDSSQRITFESDEGITIVDIGLKWDIGSKTYKPTLKQVISMPKMDGKTPTKNTSG